MIIRDLNSQNNRDCLQQDCLSPNLILPVFALGLYSLSSAHVFPFAFKTLCVMGSAYF